MMTDIQLRARWQRFKGEDGEGQSVYDPHMDLRKSRAQAPRIPLIRSMNHRRTQLGMVFTSLHGRQEGLTVPCLSIDGIEKRATKTYIIDLDP
jgi:hypothetical protein